MKNDPPAIWPPSAACRAVCRPFDLRMTSRSFVARQLSQAATGKRITAVVKHVVAAQTTRRTPMLKLSRLCGPLDDPDPNAAVSLSRFGYRVSHCSGAATVPRHGIVQLVDRELGQGYYIQM